MRERGRKHCGKSDCDDLPKGRNNMVTKSLELKTMWGKKRDA